MTAHPSRDESERLQENLDQISERLGATSVTVGMRTNDGLNVYVDDDGSYHFAYFERGNSIFDRIGDLDDVLYWYCEGIVSTQASRHIGDREQSFLYQYEVLSRFSPEWGKRQVRELAELLRNGQPDDIALLPDIGEPL